MSDLAAVTGRIDVRGEVGGPATRRRQPPGWGRYPAIDIAGSPVGPGNGTVGRSIVDRYWFYTWRTYGTWLPGEDGFVGYYRSQDGRRVIDNVPDELPTDAIPPLARYARENMAGEPVALTREQAEAVLSQLHETAAYRGWAIDAVAVMVNHIHLVFGVPGDPDPSEILRSWKSYASRALNRLGPKLTAPRWFADSGSKRPLKAEPNRIAAICYVRDQAGPLLVWLSDEAAELVANDPPTSVAGSPESTP